MDTTNFEFQCKTKGNANPQGKPRVYFTCHPDDFARSFEKICEDIFATHDCAIYYTADMSTEIPEENRTTDLERMNLFVVPVTFRLLTQPNRAMDVDFRFAIDNHIPVLPIMLESGIDAIYSLPEKFGSLQYLNPNSTDLSEIGYSEKLKKYLESVLISDETAQRVRAAFDAYVFLSYRKKDRRLANELMRLIHKKTELRDVAVWYDEFLTPGESFKENIDRMLHDSKLFALLVTPNLLEEPDGKPNYVMGVEYPEAKRIADDTGMEILPTEMEKTDRKKLTEKFAGLPACVNYKDEAFLQNMLVVLSGVAKRENDNDHVHNYLIGLAYLEGIDVEINRDKALELITDASEAGLPEAINRLYHMYDRGDSVTLDWQKACYWAERLVEKQTELYGEEHPDTLSSLNNLAVTYGDIGEYNKAQDAHEKVYALRCKVLGEEHPDTLLALNNLAIAYEKLGEYNKARDAHEKVYSLVCELLGTEHPDTLSSMNNLATTYLKLGEYNKARDAHEKVYELRCKVLGSEHPDTLISLNSLAVTYGELGDFKKEMELEEKVYTLYCKVLGAEHPDTLLSLNNLAVTYGNLEDYNKELELNEKVYALYCKVLGAEHPDTLRSLHNLAETYGKLGDYSKEQDLEEEVYALRCKVLGSEHPDTLLSLNNLAVTYGELVEYSKALELEEKVYTLYCKVLEPDHPDTLRSLNNLVFLYGELKKYRMRSVLRKYHKSCRAYGVQNAKTLRTAEKVVRTSVRKGKLTIAQPVSETIWKYKDLLSTKTRKKLSVLFDVLGETDKAAELRKK